MRPPQGLELSAEQRAELEDLRDHLPLPSLRERAAALLKVADGIPPLEVARHGLLRRRDSDTIYRWLGRYRTQGLEGLRIRQGRGRKPAFPPQHADGEMARDALLHVLRRDPRTCGVPQSRWRLADLVKHCTWLNLETESGVSQLLERVGIHYKRGRDHVHCPDPYYQARIEEISALKKRLEEHQGKESLLSLDELTWYLQPSLARAYEEAGEARPHAECSLSSNTATRGVGTVDAFSGRVLFQSGSKIGIKQLVSFYQTVRHTYPEAQRIWIVLDT